MGEPALKTAPIDVAPREDAESEVDEANRLLAKADARDIIAWAVKRFPGRLALSSSFGATSAVMLHLVSEEAPGTPVIFVDTGYLFPETYRFAAEMRDRFDLDLRVFAPKLSAAYQEALYGKLWDKGEEGVQEYLQINKVEPMKRALDELDPLAWMAGLRSGQTDHRNGLRVVDTQNGRIKVHPILGWTEEDVASHMKTHDLPYHPLWEQGYRSIGDWHSTLPTLPGQDPREGRILGKKRECGIHLSDAENRSLTSSRL